MPNTEPEHIKQPISNTPISIRHYSEVATQTIQVRSSLSYKQRKFPC